MALNTNDQTSIRDYLLGQLRVEEQNKLEERLMVEDDLFQEFEVSKVELVEDYCAGELGPTEREWLEQHFLASAEGKHQHSLALALAHRKGRQLPPETPSVFARLITFLAANPWGVAATASAAVVLVIAVLMFRPNRTPASMAVTLSNSTITRSAESTPYQKVLLRSDVGELKVSLMLPESASAATKYRAQLDDRTDKQTVSVIAQDAQSVVVSISAEQLQAGLYSLKLFVIKPDGTEEPIPGDYFFEVQETN